MTSQEYFGDWARVIDFNELNTVLEKLNTVNPELLCPQPSNVFRAFKLCPYKELRVVFLGQDFN